LAPVDRRESEPLRRALTWPPSQERQEPQGSGRLECLPYQLLTGQEGEQLLEVLALGAQRVRRARAFRQVIQEPTDGHNRFVAVIQQVDAPNDAAFPLFDDPHISARAYRTLVLLRAQVPARRPPTASAWDPGQR